MEMASKAIGRLAMAGDTFTAEYVEFEVKRALEWLGADRNEGRRHAAVSAYRIKPSQGWGAVGTLLCFLPSEACSGRRIPGYEMGESVCLRKNLAVGTVELEASPAAFQLGQGSSTN